MTGIRDTSMAHLRGYWRTTVPKLRSGDAAWLCGVDNAGTFNARLTKGEIVFSKPQDGGKQRGYTARDLFVNTLVHGLHSFGCPAGGGEVESIPTGPQIRNVSMKGSLNTALAAAGWVEAEGLLEPAERHAAVLTVQLNKDGALAYSLLDFGPESSASFGLGAIVLTSGIVINLAEILERLAANLLLRKTGLAGWNVIAEGGR